MAEGSRALFDETVRRRIALERYSTQRTREALRFLKSLEADLMGRVAQLREEAGTRSGRIRLASQERLLESVRDLYRETYAKLQESLSEDQKSLAAAEFKAAAERFGQAAGAAGLQVSTQQLTAVAAFEIAASRPMHGVLLKDWLKDIEPSHRKRIEQALRISFAEGESLQSAVARLQAATAMNARSLEALIRTANTHISTSVSEAVHKQNEDLIEGVEWVSVLDSRTTPVCQARDGKRWPVGKGPRPPAHIQCRSTTIPILIGSEPLPRPTYGEWIKGQPASVQDEILGPARASMLRAGKLSVDKFVDMKGKPLTLKELGYTKPAPPPPPKKDVKTLISDELPGVPVSKISPLVKGMNTTTLKKFVGTHLADGKWATSVGVDGAGDVADHLEKLAVSGSFGPAGSKQALAAAKQLKLNAGIPITGVLPPPAAPVPVPAAFLAPSPAPRGRLRPKFKKAAEDLLAIPELAKHLDGVDADDIAEMLQSVGIPDMGLDPLWTRWDKVTGWERGVVNFYTGSGYKAMNAAIRTGTANRVQTTYMRLLGATLNRVPPNVTSAPVIYRGVGSMKAERIEQVLESLRTGKVLRTDAVTSFSDNQGTAALFTSGDEYEGEDYAGMMWRIKNPKGHKNIRDVSNVKSENESVYPPGAKFRVKGFAPEGDYLMVDLEEVFDAVDPGEVMVARSGTRPGSFTDLKRTGLGIVVGKPRAYRGALRSARQRATDQVLRGMAKTGHEHATVLDGKGRVVWSGTDGNTHSVGIRGLNRIKPGDHAEIHHSHPDDQSFSVEDLLVTQAGGRTKTYIYAHTVAGSRFKARVLTTMAGVEETSTYAGAIAEQMVAQMLPGTSRDLNSRFSWHVTMLALKKEKRIQYSAALSQEHRELVARLGKDRLDQIVKRVADYIEGR